MTSYEAEEWENVRNAVDRAVAMHFDGCHKIYLSMDKEQVAQSEEWGYDTVTPNFDVLKEWYEESCFLKFVNAVSTVKGEPNAGYEVLIPQGFDEDEDDEDDYDPYDYDEWD